MWQSLGQFILKKRLALLLILAALTSFMIYHASKVELSYEFARAIPTDHPKYLAYQQFRKKFGEDGNLLVIGIQTDTLFRKDLFNDYIRLYHQLKNVNGVTEVISVPSAINLIKIEATEKLQATPVFQGTDL